MKFTHECCLSVSAEAFEAKEAEKQLKPKFTKLKALAVAFDLSLDVSRGRTSSETVPYLFDYVFRVEVRTVCEASRVLGVAFVIRDFAVANSFKYESEDTYPVDEDE